MSALDWRDDPLAQELLWQAILTAKTEKRARRLAQAIVAATSPDPRLPDSDRSYRSRSR